MRQKGLPVKLLVSTLLLSMSLGLYLPGSATAQQFTADSNFHGGSLVHWLSKGIEPTPLKSENRTLAKRRLKAVRTIIKPAAYEEQRPRTRRSREIVEVQSLTIQPVVNVREPVRRTPRLIRPAKPKASDKPVPRSIEIAKRTTTGNPSDQAAFQPIRPVFPPSGVPHDLPANLVTKEWWNGTGQPSVLALRDCLGSYGKRENHHVKDVNWAALLVSAIESDCREPFDNMVQTFAQEKSPEGVQAILRALTEEAFLPALKLAPNTSDLL